MAMEDGTDVDRQMLERVPFLPEHPLSKTHIAWRRRGKRIPCIPGIPKLPSDECEDAEKLAEDREKYAAFMLSVLYPGILDLEIVPDTLWSFFRSWIQTAPRWKRKFVDNCEAIRNDGKQYGERFAQNRITKAEYDQMRDFIRAENESDWETDYEEAIEGDKASLEVRMGRSGT